MQFHCLLAFNHDSSLSRFYSFVIIYSELARSLLFREDSSKSLCLVCTEQLSHSFCGLSSFGPVSLCFVPWSCQSIKLPRGR